MRAQPATSGGGDMDAITDAVESFEVEDDQAHSKFGSDPNKNKKSGSERTKAFKWKKGMDPCNGSLGCVTQHRWDYRMLWFANVQSQDVLLRMCCSLARDR